jgi:ABC-type dipeptide/oligopeptide/nickel transport system permease component
MVGRAVSRTASVAAMALAGCLIAFLLGYYGPGDPVRTILGETWTTPAQYEMLKHNLGLDRPLFVQFGDYVWKALHGDLGTSWQQGRPVGTLIGNGLSITLQLTLAAIAITAVLGIPLGLLAAMRHNGVLDRSIVLSSIALHAIPPYVLAPILLVVFVLKLHMLPVTLGWTGLFSSQAIVPILTLALGSFVFIVRQMRNAALEVMAEEHMRTAVAMGLSPWVILTRHLLPNALGPVINQLGIGFGGLFVNTVFIESIFNIPGFGSLLYNSVIHQDLPVLIATTMVAIVTVSLAYLVTDVLLALVDRRIRLG